MPRGIHGWRQSGGYRRGAQCCLGERRSCRHVSRLDRSGATGARRRSRLGQSAGGLALAGNAVCTWLSGRPALHIAAARLTAIATETFDSIDPAAHVSAVLLGGVDPRRTTDSSASNVSEAAMARASCPTSPRSIPARPMAEGRTPSSFAPASATRLEHSCSPLTSAERSSARCRIRTARGSYFSGIVGADACVKPRNQCDLSKGIAVDPASRTITFHLTAPDPDFLDKLALPSAYAIPANTPLERSASAARNRSRT